MESDKKKCGVVAIIGRPSAGKSTFLNAVCGQNVAIASPVPQTTRNAIRGIVNDIRGQIVFVDTPGIHRSEKKFNLKLQEVATSFLKDADAILYLIDASRAAGEEEKLVCEIAKPFAKKTFVAINKIDLKNADSKNAKFFLQNALLQISENRVFEISAKTQAGLCETLSAIFEFLPASPMLYDGDCYTDQDVSFRISEVIRGEAIARLEQEIPHSLYVQISDIEFRTQKKLWVRAFLCVERESQKGIAIGKNGEMVKAIRLAALKKLCDIFEWKIDLELSVKVDKNWRQHEKTLSKILR